MVMIDRWWDQVRALVGMQAAHPKDPFLLARAERECGEIYGMRTCATQLRPGALARCDQEIETRLTAVPRAR
ncbi:hypothetical protein SAMN05421833_103147 [Microbispora rosea]|uniref:Uncharacterized protein n=1 Tax=Microbispora rosea TaxID=58117 RepID=A0A1N6UT71_9ACTN|nr:hypothetical protein Mro03_18330 [Microbispora rosea subsp. rosea]SIQ68834.1 hypothetical protein SAMN05421833_103147 [Microbispora rosea]